MSSRLLATGAVLAFVMGNAPLRAGIYNPAEPGEDARNPNFVEFEKSLFLLKTIGASKIERDNPLRMRYVLMADTAPRAFPSNWSMGQRLSIEAYLIRRRRFAEAIELITPQMLRERGNFLQTSNLAMAYFLDAQEPQRAIDYLRQAIDNWPASIDAAGELKPILHEMNWTDLALKFHKDAEKTLLKLFRLRFLEMRRKEKNLPEAPDDLFNVRFVGDSGKFEPAKLAAAERAKLPANALAVVQQLLIWMPDDARLFWLLGELYNARAEPGRLTPRSRKEAIEIKQQEDADLAACLRIFNELAGFNGPLRVPALVERLQAMRAVAVPASSGVEDPSSDAPPRTVDWRALAIGFGTGVLGTLFGYWQFRELRRRRQRK
ncbi:MAG: hypothetical protein FJ271_11140 [Planctomycetes bacterium]|nr:hypothetical protein [Planctomycetota bacterium]